MPVGLVSPGCLTAAMRVCGSAPECGGRSTSRRRRPRVTPPSVGRSSADAPTQGGGAVMTREMRGAAAVVGIGQTPWYKRGTAPDPEMKLALRAIVAAADDAGIDPRDIDGFVSWG